jgi:hypothetical protein
MRFISLFSFCLAAVTAVPVDDYKQDWKYAAYGWTGEVEPYEDWQLTPFIGGVPQAGGDPPSLEVGLVVAHSF